MVQPQLKRVIFMTRIFPFGLLSSNKPVIEIWLANWKSNISACSIILITVTTNNLTCAKKHISYGVLNLTLKLLDAWKILILKFSKGVWMRDLVLNFIGGGIVSPYVTYPLFCCRLMSSSIRLIFFFKCYVFLQFFIVCLIFLL